MFQFKGKAHFKHGETNKKKNMSAMVKNSKKKEGKGRRKEGEGMGGRRKDEGGRLLREHVSIVIIFINSLIIKVGKDLDFILQVRK